MPRDLRQFLQAARAAGPEFYVEVKKPLNPKYEVGVLQNKLAKQGRFPVLYCPHIIGSNLPLVANLFGSYALLGLALGVSPERMREAGNAEVFKEFNARRQNRYPVNEVPASASPVREIVLKGQDIDLGVLPLGIHAELNPGKYLTAGMTISRNPDTGQPNMGIYGQVWKARDKLAVMMRPTHHGGLILQRYKESGSLMEVVTIVGHHPAVGIGAGPVAPLGSNELEVAGGLLGESLEVTKALTVDLPVPAFAEIAIEGVIDPTALDNEGPFIGDGENYYRAGASAWIMQVTAITMRKNAIYQDIQPSHQEHRLGVLLGREGHIFDRTTSQVPSVRAVHIGPEGHCGKNFVYVSLRKRSEDEPEAAGLAALAADPTPKVAIVVDDDIDIYDDREVMWAVGTRVRKNLIVSPNGDGQALQVAKAECQGGAVDFEPRTTRILLDATKPLNKAFRTTVTPPRDLWQSMKPEDYLR